MSDNVRISKHKNIFTKSDIPYWSEGVFVIKKLKILYRGDMLLMILTERNFWNVLRKIIAKSKLKPV